MAATRPSLRCVPADSNPWSAHQSVRDGRWHVERRSGDIGVADTDRVEERNPVFVPTAADAPPSDAPGFVVQMRRSSRPSRTGAKTTTTLGARDRVLPSAGATVDERARWLRDERGWSVRGTEPLVGRVWSHTYAPLPLRFEAAYTREREHNPPGMIEIHRCPNCGGKRGCEIIGPAVAPPELASEDEPRPSGTLVHCRTCRHEFRL
jgi:hypothetical protein